MVSSAALPCVARTTSVWLIDIATAGNCYRFMGWIRAHKLLVGTALVAIHVAMAVGFCSLSFWLYFQANVKWTPDPVVPQITGVFALIGQGTAAFIFVPAGLAASRYNSRGLPIAILGPLTYAAIAFLLPNIFVWLIGAIALLVTGRVLLRRTQR